MKIFIASELQQIHLGIGPNGYEAIAHCKTKNTTYEQEHSEFQARLLSICPACLWPKSSYRAGCPRPILVNKHHQHQLEKLHEALTAAITDIVARWWTDHEARFPERMPLGKEEEGLLQWLESQTLCGNLQKYPARLGSWRPDFLIEDNRSTQDGSVAEVFQITEINARFSFNGFMHEAYGQQALDDKILAAHSLVGATDPRKIIDGLFSLFRPNVPLHLLKGEEQGIDIHMFIDAIQRRLGVTPRLISPSDLRLVPHTKDIGGYRLCCIVGNGTDLGSHPTSSALFTSEGEMVEEIHQVGLELHQHELFALEPEMLRQISLRCFNDMRTILLVHDKRMLGIVKQELQQLVARKVLTPSQARVLDKGVADTILPGSPRLNQLLQDSRCSPKLKDEYILKPVRGGKGAGIVFGEDLTPHAWTFALERLRSPELISNTTYVVQHRIIPRLYDVILKESGERSRYPLVGTYHVVGGKLLGLGTWRSSGNRICAVSCGGAWICSAIAQE
ncbi:hypothetical protein F4779DRAFT_635052 [Xylariaceae sp. FL0662B]|nr:hypothetical protein F4779DRAFT_635052 [Xylariaceae sp. FL0662B]